jgi:hypothetical protein
MPNISVFCITYLKNNKGPKTYENHLVTGNIKIFLIYYRKIIDEK